MSTNAAYELELPGIALNEEMDFSMLTNCANVVLFEQYESSNESQIATAEDCTENLYAMPC